MKILWLIISLLIVIQFLAAQEDKPIIERLNQFKAELKLSDEQASKIETILKTSEKQLQEARQQNQGDRRALQSAFREQKEWQDEQIGKILTPEQQKEYAELKKKDIRDPQVLELVERLKLSDQQVEQVREIMDNFQTAMQEQRQGTMDRQGRREAMMKLRAESDAQIENILTEEQKKEFKKYKSERDEQMRQNRGPGRRGGQRPF